MVLSLVDLSIRSITKGIRDGTIRYPHLLPQNLRERVMDKAIKQSLANHPNVLALTSVEFLTGMTSLTVEAGTKDDLIFLERLQESLVTKLPNGDTIGADITKLNIIVRGSSSGNDNASPDLSAASDLIAQCPNTTSLDLRRTDWSPIKGCWPLTEESTCSRVMENLIELSLCEWSWSSNLDHPIVNFRQLTTLKLNNCSVEGDLWPEVLKNIQSVENLHLFDVSFWRKEGLDWILLPYPLPHLKSLEVVGDKYKFSSLFVCNKTFVNNLMECPKLRQVHLMLDQSSTDEESLVRLAGMDIDLKMKIRLALNGKDPAKNVAVFDSSMRFKIVRIFHERMYSFELYDCYLGEWDPQYSTAFEDVLSTCSNLTEFGISQCFIVFDPQTERDFYSSNGIERRKRANAAMVQFFGNLDRAQQISRLVLAGNFDETVLSTIFKSCVNVIRLEIVHCPTLRDQHLIDWVSLGGGNLTELVVQRCENVTSEGIIPILVKSADRLLRCHCFGLGLGRGNGGRNWKTVFNNQCPNATLIVI